MSFGTDLSCCRIVVLQWMLYLRTNSRWIDVKSIGQFEIGPPQSIHIDLYVNSPTQQHE